MPQSQSRTWCVTDRWCDVDHLTLDERWKRVESWLLTVELAALAQWKLHGSCRAADLYGEHTTTAAAAHTHSFNLLNEALSKFVSWCQLRLTRAFVTWQDWTKITARARVHTIFEWSAIVTTLHHSRYRLLTQRRKIAQISYRYSVWGSVRDDRRPNFVIAI